MSARFVLPFYVCMRKKRQGKGLEPWNWLQVIFHLQKRQPPVLPPLHVLFQQPPDAVSERPMHAGKTQDFSHLQGFGQRVYAWSSSAPPNSETLLQLFASFFECHIDAIASWKTDANARRVWDGEGALRCSAWVGDWYRCSWPGVGCYCIASIEDLFDSRDNCGRSIDKRSIGRILAAFQSAAALMSRATEHSDEPVADHMIGVGSSS